MPYITFIRHGKSIVDDRQKMKGADMRGWIEEYDRSGIHAPSRDIKALQGIGKEEPFILSSSLKRAGETAVHLFGPATVEMDSIFREADLPDPPKLFSSFRMPASGWCAVMRVLWLCGYARHAEPVGKARERALAAASRLIALSAVHEHTVLVGHGFFNRMIARVLLKNGWKPESSHGNKHWGLTTYTKAE